MARFDLYPNPYPEDRSHTPYVLDVQNTYLEGLATRVVIPLRTAKALGPAARGLNPLVEVSGQTLYLDTASLAPVPASMLKHPSLLPPAARADVVDALDVLFGAY